MNHLRRSHAKNNYPSKEYLVVIFPYLFGEKHLLQFYNCLNGKILVLLNLAYDRVRIQCVEKHKRNRFISDVI